MSGIKRAEVSTTLSKALSGVRKQIAECGSTAASAAGVGAKNYERMWSAANKGHEGIARELPPHVENLSGEDIANWRSLIDRHDRAYKDAGSLSRQADERLARYEDLRKKSDSCVVDLERCERGIRASLEGKNWYCEAENEQAKKLRSTANGVLAKLRNDLSIAREALRLRQSSFSRLAESEKLAQLAQREYDRLLKLSMERKEQERIAEENRRRVAALVSDIESLRTEIEGRNYRKFGDGNYSAAEVDCELSRIEDLIAAGKLEKACADAKTVKGRLGGELEAIEAAQLAWESEKVSAEKALSDAREECASINMADVKMYSGVRAEQIDVLFSMLDSIAALISDERFSAAKESIDDSLRRVRDVREKTEENKRLSQQRDEIAQAIMYALYKANFDTPEYYLQEGDNSLSGLCVVAAAPGGVGDMKLTIDLAGRTSFEVENIPEGHEQLCIDQIRSLQQRLSESGVRFDVTDWGRARNENRVQVGVGGHTTTTQRTIQRQG